MYASLPPLSRAPFKTGTGSYDCYQRYAGLSGKSRNFAIEYRKSGRCGTKYTARSIPIHDAALTVTRPRPMVAAAIACHADSSDVPLGRFSTRLRAYTVIR